jgi:DNA mismatch repair protein MutH
MASIPRELAESYLEELATAYHATVEALLKRDQEWIAEGLGMLDTAIGSINEGIGEYLYGD